MSRAQIGLVLVLVAACWPVVASGAECDTSEPPFSGVITGQVAFFQNQQHFCDPAIESCFGSMYLRAEYQTMQPLRDLEVQLRDDGNRIVGRGATDEEGRFRVQWLACDIGAEMDARVLLVFRHSDSRFRLVNHDGDTWYGEFAVTLEPYSTMSDPQVLGTRTFGNSSANYSGHANIFDGASDMWRSLADSERMRTYFEGVRIRVFDTTGFCPSGRCAEHRRVWIGTGTVDPYLLSRQPMDTILHEMGHIAEQFAARGRYYTPFVSYEFAGSAGWSDYSPEWAADSAREAMANFLGVRTFFRRAALLPSMCRGVSGPRPACSQRPSAVDLDRPTCMNGSRTAAAATSFFWDVYDGIPYDPLDDDDDAVTFSQMIDGINSFPEGMQEGEENEPFRIVGGSVRPTDPDGRSAKDHALHLSLVTGRDFGPTLRDNCRLDTIGD